MAEEDYLKSNLCEYTGPASDLPTGGYYKPVSTDGKPWGPERLAFRWKVSAPEEEAGILFVRTSELTAAMDIIGVVLNRNLIQEIVNTYTDNFMQIADANGTKFMSPAAWKENYGTDGVALVAIRNKRFEFAGTGVKAQPRKRNTDGGVHAVSKGKRTPVVLGKGR